MKIKLYPFAPAVAAFLVASGINPLQAQSDRNGSTIDDGPVLVLPQRSTAPATTVPAENLPPPGSLPAQTGGATGRAQAVEIDIGKAPETSGIPIPRLNVFEIATASESFTTFVAAVKSAGLDAVLQGAGPFTVLAPNNAAFASLPQGVLDNLLLPENLVALRSVLAYHIIPQRLSSRQLLPGLFLTTQGEAVEFMGGAEGVVTIQEANIVQANVDATNGIIHAIDKVLLPPTFVIENYTLPPVKGLVSPFEGIVVDPVPVLPE